MKKTIFVLAALCGSLQAQNAFFQQAGAIAVGGPALTTSFGPVTLPPAGTGPYSATETRHSLQILDDGTRIERTETTQVARDAAGRTRTENDNTISIYDPNAGVSYVLDKTRKTVNRMLTPVMAMRAELDQTRRAVEQAKRDMEQAKQEIEQTRVAIASMAGEQIMIATAGPVARSASKPAEEDLGTQLINGVVAKGTRTTITIAAGEIGNDRPIQVVNERWYSDALQMMVKTSNSDPRFGTTDFELTNVTQTPPDPSLFEVPAGYTNVDRRR